jgi:hypothetical protein
MGTLNFGAGEDVMKRGLDRSCFWQESPVEIQHPQETSELTDCLRRRTGLEINDSFREKLQTQERDFVAKE